MGILIGDSAFPPAQYPTEVGGQPVQGWCVYIPGGDAYHGWSQAEIDNLKAQPWCRYLVPVFVRSNPQGVAQAEADAAVAIAWAKAQGQPAGTLTMMDYETAVDSVYELTFDQKQREGDGDLEILYGSKSTVIQNTAPSGGYDEAEWTGQIPGSLASMAQQFSSNDAYDMNLFRDGAPLWDLRAPVAPTPPAPAAHSLEEDDMSESIKPLSVYPAGEYAYDVPDGRTQLRLTADGNQGAPAELRIAFYDAAGHVMATIGDDPVKSPPVPVGGKAPHVVGHKLPAGCAGVTVNRKDSQAFTVAVGFHA